MFRSQSTCKRHRHGQGTSIFHSCVCCGNTIRICHTQTNYIFISHCQYCVILTMNAEIQGLFTFPLILYLYNYITRLMFFQALMTYNLTYQRDPYAKTTPVDIEDNLFACPHHSGNPQHYLVFQRRIIRE